MQTRPCYRAFRLRRAVHEQESARELKCNGRIPSIELIKPKSHLETLDQADTHSPTFSNPVVLSALCCPRSPASFLLSVSRSSLVVRPSSQKLHAAHKFRESRERRTDAHSLTNPELITFSLADFRRKEGRSRRERLRFRKSGCKKICLKPFSIFWL